MDYVLNFDGKRHPLTVERVEFMRGSSWTWTYCVQVPEGVEAEIGEFETECIHFALIDGWSSSGCLGDDDSIHWSIEDQDGRIVDRDDLEDELNPGRLVLKQRFGARDVLVEARQISVGRAWHYVHDYCRRNGMRVAYMDNYGDLTVAVVEDQCAI